MPAFDFINETGRHKFYGQIDNDGIQYEYIIYLSPFTEPNEINEIVTYFGNRLYRGKPCLDLTETDISDMISDRDVSAFFIVRVNGIEHVASGTLQIYNHCNLKNDYDVWINDVCKITSDKDTGKIGKPVDVMFMLMEQLVVQNLGKDNIKLVVENGQISEEIIDGNLIKKDYSQFLVKRYEDLGFSLFNSPKCLRNFKNSTIMRKTSLQPITSVIDFSFLDIPPTSPKVIGGKYKKQKTRKRKTIRKKTHRRNRYKLR